MVKKRLVDLLREEGHKSLEPGVETVQSSQESTEESPDPEIEAVQEAIPNQLLKLDTAVSVTEPLDEITAEPYSVTKSVAPRAKGKAPIKAELETTVTELRELLQEAQRREDSLQQQITDLQSTLKDQKILLQKLQVESSQANQIKEEFEQAKKVILQLTEVNSQLTQEVNTLRKENESSKPQKFAVKQLPQQVIQSNSPSTKLFNSDVGWFD